MVDCSKMADVDGVYASPGGAELLHALGNALRSQDGRLTFPVRGGIPRFLRYLPAETPADSERLDRLNCAARARGWADALSDVLGRESPMYRYVTDEAHARFVEVLPVAGATILEVGAGLGQITTVIARKASVVCALEVVAGQAEFVAERARQCGQRNVAVACGGDDCWLPYRTGLFDVAVLNLVLEWCGMRDPGDAQTSQVRLLAEVKRVLRPGGMLYLCTKNRFGLHYLLGIPDEHVQGIRFGSAMPRWLSRAVLSLRRRGRPAGLLHSYRGIRRMLHAAGYSELRSYWAVPEMRFPRQLIATDAEAIAAARGSGLVEGDSRRVRTVMPLVPGALVKYVTPGLVFTARA